MLSTSIIADHLDEKVLEIESNLLMQNIEYKGLIHQCNNLYTQIKLNLPDQYKLLIGQYEKTQFLQQGMAIEQAYFKGYQDALLQLQQHSTNSSLYSS